MYYPKLWNGPPELTSGGKFLNSTFAFTVQSCGMDSPELTPDGKFLNSTFACTVQ